MRKEHAEHNESLCELLLNNGNYNDWVITTAFYSAIHFVRHKIFPLDKYDPQTGSQESFSNFNDYLNRFSRVDKNRKHKAIKINVKDSIYS